MLLELKQIKFFFIMKKINVILCLVVLASVVVFSSCEDEKVEPKTSLELTIRNSLGNPVSGASVKLFTSLEDWKNLSNQKGSTKLSDASGKVKFDDLSPSNYFWFAGKGCETNYFGGSATVSPLTKGRMTTINTVLSSTGGILFTNKSNEAYTVSIVGGKSFEMEGNTKKRVIVKTGSVTVNIAPKSNPSEEETYIAKVDCGDKQAIDFPQNK